MFNWTDGKALGYNSRRNKNIKLIQETSVNFMYMDALYVCMYICMYVCACVCVHATVCMWRSEVPARCLSQLHCTFLTLLPWDKASHWTQRSPTCLDCQANELLDSSLLPSATFSPGVPAMWHWVFYMGAGNWTEVLILTWPIFY